MSERAFRVELSRQVIPTRIVRGVEVFEDSGLNYVDVFFPDGTQHVCGYIGRDLVGTFAPLSGVDAALAKLIQCEINKQTGAQQPAPEVIEQIEPEEDDQDDE